MLFIGLVLLLFQPHSDFTKELNGSNIRTSNINSAESNGSQLVTSYRSTLDNSIATVDYNYDEDFSFENDNNDDDATALPVNKDFHFNDDTLHKGSLCEFDTVNQLGWCMELPNCSLEFNYVKMLKKQHYKPWKLCGFDQLMPIVCCPSSYNATIELHNRNYNAVWNLAVEEFEKSEQVSKKIRRKGCFRYMEEICRPKNEKFDQKNISSIRVVESTMTRQARIQLKMNLIYQQYFSRGEIEDIPFARILTETVSVKPTNVSSREFQSVVAVGFEKESKDIVWTCGGALISDQFVLTSAHCTFHTNWGIAKWVRVGDLDLIRNADDARVAKYEIAQSIRHPLYKEPFKYHDIALLKLKQRVDFNDWTKPACLSDEDFYGEDADRIPITVIGWSTQFSLESPVVYGNFWKASVNQVRQDQCQQIYGNDPFSLPIGVVNDWQFCVGALELDPCWDGNGVPLLVKLKEHNCLWDITGVTSFSNSCNGDKPGIYVRVKHYIDWIESIVWE